MLGTNDAGQLGLAGVERSDTPTTVPGLDGVVAISAGGLHTCAVRSDGSVWCWGDYQWGEVGNAVDSHPVPTPIAGVTDATAVVSGSSFACAETGTGPVCWGRNNLGQFGRPDGLGADDIDLTPGPIVGLSGGVTSLAGGSWHGCATISGGGVDCWGHNFYGQLGSSRSLVIQRVRAPERWCGADRRGSVTRVR